MTSIPKRTLAIVVLLAMLCITFAGGVYVGKEHYSKTVTVHDQMPPTENSIPLHGESEVQTQTSISYRPKPITYDAKTGKQIQAPDIDMKIGKPDLKVKVNGAEVNVKKADDEKYVFDKGQLKVTQDSVAEFRVSVDPIDNTKHYGVGIGVTSEGKPAGIVTAPINKKHGIDGWVTGDADKNVAGGLMIRF